MQKLTLGQKIKFFRSRANMSQLDLECELLSSNGTISRIESGRVNPTKETILAISEALHLNMLEIAYLFDIDVLQILSIEYIRELHIKDLEKSAGTEEFWSKVFQISSAV